MLPIFSRLTTLNPTSQEKHRAVSQVIEESSLTGGFYVMLLCATVIVTVGLMMGNATMVIGGMLVSPMLAPVLSLALGIAMGERGLAVRSLWIVLLMSAFVFVVTLLMGIFVPFTGVNMEIVSRIHPTLAYSVVALFAGVAATVSYTKPSLNVTLPGVAIAIALLPPLSVSALGLVLMDGEMLFGAFGLYLVNLLGIVLASVVVFALVGVYPLRREAKQWLTREQRES